MHTHVAKLANPKDDGPLAFKMQLWSARCLWPKQAARPLRECVSFWSYLDRTVNESPILAALLL